MSRVVRRHAGDQYEGEPPPTTMRERGEFVGHALVKGASTFGGKLAALSGFVGGSVLTYLLFVVHLSLPWVLVAVLVLLLITFVVGAFQLWDMWRRTALAFAPTWEHCQAQGDTLKAFTEEFLDDGSGGFMEPDQIDQQRRNLFRREYMNAHMAFVKGDFDRAAAAGYAPDFDRDRIGTAGLSDVVEFAAEFENVAQRWRTSGAAG